MFDFLLCNISATQCDCHENTENHLKQISTTVTEYPSGPEYHLLSRLYFQTYYLQHCHFLLIKVSANLLSYFFSFSEIQIFGQFTVCVPEN